VSVLPCTRVAGGRSLVLSRMDLRLNDEDAIIAAPPRWLNLIVPRVETRRHNEARNNEVALSRGADTWIASCAEWAADAALRAYANAVSDGLARYAARGWLGQARCIAESARGNSFYSNDL